jgi:hypothetical protein
VSGVIFDLDIREKSPFTCCFLERRCFGCAHPCSLLMVGSSSGDKGRFPKATKMLVSPHILSTSDNNIPVSAAAGPCGNLIVSGGKDSCVWCVFFFLDFFELLGRTEVSAAGTTGAVSMAVLRCRVRGAMLVWQDNGKGRKDSRGITTGFWEGETSGGMVVDPGACRVFIIFLDHS